MATTREEVNASTGLPSQDQAKHTEEQNTRNEKRARFAKVLDRGILNTRLSVPLPPDVHGEWVRNDAGAIARMKSLGFKVDDEYAIGNALHSDGTGAPTVGDVVFMTCPKEDYEIIQEIKRERFMEMHAPKKSQREESDYSTQVTAKLQGDVPIVQESEAKTARREEIAAALDTSKGR